MAPKNAVENGATTESQQSQADAANTAVIPATSAAASMENIFDRKVNGTGLVKSIRFKRTLTLPLISISHERELLFKVTGETSTIMLPVKGRSDEPKEASVITGVNVETGEEVMLIQNAIIKSALERAGGDLKGRTFAMRENGLKADKNYRVVDIVEVDID